MSTGTGRLAWMRRHTSSPSKPGSMRSSTTRSGACCSNGVDRAGAVVGLLDDEALGAQPVGDGLVDHRLVLDDEDARGGRSLPSVMLRA